jgi:hypothetical protein
MELKEVGWENERRMELTQDHVQCWDFAEFPDSITTVLSHITQGR